MVPLQGVASQICICPISLLAELAWVGSSVENDLVHGDDPERYCGEEGGRGVHVWERM